MIDLTALLLLLPLFAFSSPKAPAPPPPPPPPPGKTDAEIQAERVVAAKAIRRRRGRASTILAGEQSGGALTPAESTGATTLG